MKPCHEFHDCAVLRCLLPPSGHWNLLLGALCLFRAVLALEEVFCRDDSNTKCWRYFGMGAVFYHLFVLTFLLYFNSLLSLCNLVLTARFKINKDRGLHIDGYRGKHSFSTQIVIIICRAYNTPTIVRR